MREEHGAHKHKTDRVIEGAARIAPSRTAETSYRGRTYLAFTCIFTHPHSGLQVDGGARRESACVRVSECARSRGGGAEKEEERVDRDV